MLSEPLPPPSNRNCCVHMVPRPVDMSCGRGAWDDCSISLQLSVGIQGSAAHIPLCPHILLSSLVR